MNIQLLAVGEKMPAWVTEGFNEYAKRIRGDCRLTLKEISAGKRAKNADIQRIRTEESQRLLAAAPNGSRIVLLDVDHKPWSTPELAQQIKSWMASGQHTTLLIGGPEGLDDICRDRADQVWSLSPLTFPHPLVRIIVAEQIYRALSILRNHPYHRAG
ncbi:MAG TPA: 23S rRNA (pseudouridine(1915)-N(3))-methyltransferase RlmH [Gammaproteobacteria bacterium]|nr:23S rRNA (pseudouridine(1915)-N(3))-methyltransferase RlmH [Gammaproteobacteria bacterium]HCO58591.1 23S rRNA (pseudouridine(1915)-N(3))-methyltransferase RlmH [Porticoccaceae bacterium]